MTQQVESPLSWDQYWVNIMNEVARKSKDPSTKVGAVIVDPDNDPVSTGYNGFPRGIVETPEMWLRPLKYVYVVHAELNAIFNAKRSVRGCRIYLPILPCLNCAKNLAAAGIAEVIYVSDYVTKEKIGDLEISSLDILAACGVKVRRFVPDPLP
jgi:dCMP deaminase